MFHVPAERWRVQDGPMGTPPDAGNFGAFLIDSCEPGWSLVLVADDGTETAWEHVSVRAMRDGKRSRVPSWREMCYVKDLCWGPDDVVMQLHPAQREYVNQHPHVLHLWRPRTGEVPCPPRELV
jgi:hypothetical protein